MAAALSPYRDEAPDGALPSGALVVPPYPRDAARRGKRRQKTSAKPFQKPHATRKQGRGHGGGHHVPKAFRPGRARAGDRAPRTGVTSHTPPREQLLETLRALQHQIQRAAERKGWSDPAAPRPVGELLMLVTTEVAEAMEAYRAIPATMDVAEGVRRTYSDYRAHGAGTFGPPLAQMAWPRDGAGALRELVLRDLHGRPMEPEGIPSEIADAVIRLFQFAGEYGFDLASVILAKLLYNDTRSHRHGGKRA